MAVANTIERRKEKTARRKFLREWSIRLMRQIEAGRESRVNLQTHGSVILSLKFSQLAQAFRGA